MCNLNLLVKNNKFDGDEDLLNFYNSACFNSYISNNDNEGFYFSEKNQLLTSDKKINLFNYDFVFNKSRFVLGHQRYTTSGAGLEYAQPFKKNGFVLVHNGVINKLEYKGHSDTFNLFEKFIKTFIRYENVYKRTTAIKKAIEKTLNKKGGRFSIGLYDEQTKTLYYFKNSPTSIYGAIHKDKNALFLTTKYQNIDFLNAINDDFKELEIDDDAFYIIKFTDKNKISIKKKVLEIGTENETPIIKNYNFSVVNSDKSIKTSNEVKSLFTQERLKEERNTIQEFKAVYNITDDHNYKACASCLEYTRNSISEFGALCDYCIIEQNDLIEDDLRSYNKGFMPKNY